MPKKSNRSSHGSAMSNLFPDVNLDDDASDDNVSEEEASAEPERSSSTEAPDEQKNSSTELQNSSPAAPRPPSTISPVPEQRPNLDTKLGPYVSADVSDALEDVYLQLRRRFGANASKSLIVEAALRLTLHECQTGGGNSALERWMESVVNGEDEDGV